MLPILQSALDALLAQGYIEVTKKKGRKVTTKQVAFEGRLIGTPQLVAEDEGIVMRFTTYQGNEGALRPDKFIDAMLEFAAGSAPELVALKRSCLRAE